MIKLLFKLALKLTAKVIAGGTVLTPEYLISKGFVYYEGFYFEPDVKGRDQIYIKFGNGFYHLYHSSAMTFIALEKTQEWFDMYYLLTQSDVRYN